MEELTNQITNYIEYLNTETFLKVSVHFAAETYSRFPLDALSEFLPYNTHKNPYCAFVKGNNLHRCLNEQKLLYGTENSAPFFSECFAGVVQYITPVTNGKNVVGFISVSGYRNKTSDKNILNKTLWKNNALQNEFDEKFVRTLIFPLKIMLEIFVKKTSVFEFKEINLIINYINEHKGAVSFLNVCEKFNRSRSHISHLFKKSCGYSFKEYCNNLKLDIAADMLKTTDLPVTQVALESGFNDVSYFIKMFKTKFGLSPMKYKKLF